MKVVQIDPITSENWQTFIDRHSGATVFHHPSWLQVLKRQYNFEVFAICVLDKMGSIKAGIPFCKVRSITNRYKWVSLPYSDHCEILYHDVDDVGRILEYLIVNCKTKHVHTIEIRSKIPGNHDFQESTDMVIHRLELNKDPEEIRSKFKSSHDRGIRKALKSDLKVDRSRSKTALHEFYRLHIKTRSKLGVPIQPKRYFDHLYEQLFKENIGFIMMILKGNKAIAASVFLDYGTSFVFKYGASDTSYLGLRPNNFLFWSAIREACERDFKYFDFGRTDTVQLNLRRFKSGWGATEKALSYSFYPQVAENDFFHFSKEKIVTPLLKRSPEFICRLTGELLYRFFP